ncbi:MAG: hypothetical protein ACRDMZ_07060 [Solirubrobacteraceae bacterium]
MCAGKGSNSGLAIGDHDREMRVLVVEDEVPLAKLVRQGLMAEGELADIAVSGEDALWMAAATQ